MMREFGSTAFWYLSRIVFSFLYFLPTIVAARSRHPKQSVILLLNFLLGWTVVVWIIALRWALEPNTAGNE